MTQIYKLVDDVDRFATFNFDDMEQVINDLGSELFMNFGPSALSLKPCWSDWKGGFDVDDDHAIPDISLWTQNALVLSSKAKEALQGIIEPCGELLDLNCTQGTFFLFNCLARESANAELSEALIDRGVQAGVEKLVFDSVSYPIFQTEFDLVTHFYCTDAFKKVVEDHQLVGIGFDMNLAS